MIIETVTITTASDGSATAYTGKLTGTIIAITYDGGMATGADLTITTETTNQPVLVKADAGTSAVTYRPVQALQLGTDGSDLTQYDYIRVADERVKIVIAQGGNADTGVFQLIVDED